MKMYRARTYLVGPERVFGMLDDAVHTIGDRKSVGPVVVRHASVVFPYG